MGSLQRDPAEVRDFIDELGEVITFPQFIDLMQKIENKIVSNQEQPQLEGGHHPQQLQQPGQGNISNIQADTKVLDFLRLLEEYRRKCEEQGNYAEARKARAKFEELLRKETQRQKNNIRAA